MGCCGRIRSSPIQSLPAGYENLLWILTANDDKKRNDESFLSFTVNKPVRVLVAYDKRGKELPYWMRSFSAEGLEVKVSDDNASPLNLFGKDFPAGRITLGANYASGASGAKSNYVVLLRAVS